MDCEKSQKGIIYRKKRKIKGSQFRLLWQQIHIDIRNLQPLLSIPEHQISQF